MFLGVQSRTTNEPKRMPTKKEQKIATGGKYEIGIHKASQRYSKKLKGVDGKWRVVYLGKVGGPAALRRAEKAWELKVAENAQKVVHDPTSISIADAIDDFYSSRLRADISEQNVREYKRLCKIAYDALKPYSVAAKDLTPKHYELVEAAIRAKYPDMAPTTTKTRFAMVRAIFHWIGTNRTGKEPWFGEALKKPSKRTIRIYQQKKQDEEGRKYFEPCEIRKMLDLDGIHPKYRAAILLGVNCGIYESDLIEMERSHITGSILENIRPKTGEYRRAYLWTETLEAIEDLGDGWFPRCHGWLANYFSDNVQKPAGVYRRGRAFSALRHCFFTHAEPIDPLAARLFMGHVAADEVAAAYREGLRDERLIAVADGVRRWLFGEN